MTKWNVNFACINNNEKKNEIRISMEIDFWTFAVAE